MTLVVEIATVARVKRPTSMTTNKARSCIGVRNALLRIPTIGCRVIVPQVDSISERPPHSATDSRLKEHERNETNNYGYERNTYQPSQHSPEGARNFRQQKATGGD